MRLGHCVRSPRRSSPCWRIPSSAAPWGVVRWPSSSATSGPTRCTPPWSGTWRGSLRLEVQKRLKAARPDLQRDRVEDVLERDDAAIGGGPAIRGVTAAQGVLIHQSVGGGQHILP